MKSFISLLFLSLTPLVVIGQNASDIQNRSDSTERPQPAPLSASSDNNSGSSNVSASDTGAQRPISLKKKGISSYFGYDSKYFYRSNPLATASAMKQPTGMWIKYFLRWCRTWCLRHGFCRYHPIHRW